MTSNIPAFLMNPSIKLKKKKERPTWQPPQMLQTHTWQPHMGVVHGCNRTGLCHVDEYVCSCSVKSSSSHTHEYTLSLSHSLRVSDSVSVRPRRRNKLITSGGVNSPLLLLSSLRHLLTTLYSPTPPPPLAHFLTPREPERSGSGQTWHIYKNATLTAFYTRKYVTGHFTERIYARLEEEMLRKTSKNSVRTEEEVKSC